MLGLQPSASATASTGLPRYAVRKRLTNAFSKKFDNHVHALSLYFVFYNFCRIHKTLRVSPAMAAGVTDRLWSLEDVIARIDADAPAPAKRGPYKKRDA